MATESKQIDGVVDDPENGGLKSGPCLIAGFHALSCNSPSYYNPYRGVNKNTLSVDMVRLSLTFRGDRGEWLSRKGAQLTDCDEMSAWTSKIRPGGWYELWSFALGGSSVALGIGFMEPSCKVNMNRGFIEFNPNKVAGDKRFWRLLEKLAPRSARMTTKALKRDLAALEKDMSPVTLASEARDAARASNARRGNVPQRDRGQSR